MIHWDGCKARQIASAPRKKDYVGCKRCKSAYPTDFLSVRDYLWHEITQSMGLVYWYGSKVPPKYISFLYWKGPFSSNFSKWYIWKQSLYSKWILFYYIFVLFINSSVCVYINCTCLVGGENVRENWWAVFSNVLFLLWYFDGVSKVLVLVDQFSFAFHFVTLLYVTNFSFFIFSFFLFCFLFLVWLMCVLLGE